MVWANNKTNFDRNLAVIIGIDRYDNDNIHDLSTPVSDACAIANLLQTDYGFKEENTICLFSPRPDDETSQHLSQRYPLATLDNLRTLLNKTIADRLKPTEDNSFTCHRHRLIFYFAGHGLPKNSEEGPTGYLVPQDAELGKEDSFLPMSEVYDALEKLQCHHLLVILDCCFAGTFRWASSRKLIAKLKTIHREHYDRFIRFPAWQVVTSSAHDQEALDFVKLSEDRRGDPIKVNNEKHSPFALALLEALQEGESNSQGKRYQNADYTKDGVITAHELFLYLSDRVSQLSTDLQTPGLYHLKREYDKGEFIFVKSGFDPNQLAPAPKLNEENNPYRGLKSFEERHADFFFGRQKLVEELSDRLTESQCPLTVVLGTSGSGKSSLVKAGLLPHLRQKREKEQQAQLWYIFVPMRPGASPFIELARVLLPLANSNLITKLDQVSFLDKRFAEVLDPKSEQKQKDACLKSTYTDDQESSSGNKSIEEFRLPERWHKATPEAKLLLILDYCDQFKEFCHPPQEQAELFKLHNEISDTLKPLAQTLQQNPEFFKDAIAKWSQEQPHTKLLLVIDQFEELITMSQDERENGKQSDWQKQDEQKEWQRFLVLLRMALAKYRRRLHVIVTLRSDFEPWFLNSALKVHWKNARFPLRAMNSDELRDAIEEPALKQALYFEPPELVGKLIDEVGQMPGVLPLLSFTLSELYIKLHARWTKDNATDRALRIKDYEELGGVTGALTRRATQEYDNLIKEFGEESGKVYQATMRRVMLRMVTIEGGGVARRRVPDSELVYGDVEENKRVVKVRDQLVEARLLVKGQETGESYVEPSHDFLVRGWDNLQKWIKIEQEDLVLQQRLTLAANDWAIGKGGLWTREVERLSRLKKLLDSSDNNWLNQRETEFVIESTNQQLDELKEAERQRDEAIEGQISSLISLSETRILTKDRLGALFAAVKASIQLNKASWLRDKLSIQVYQALEQSVYGVQELNRLEGNTEPVNSVCFSTDGKMLATANWDKTVKVWSVDGVLLKIFTGHTGEVNAVAFSYDGKLIASGSSDKTIKIWRLGDETLLNTFEGHSMKVLGVSFNLNAQIVASASEDGTVKLWKVSDSSLIKTLQSHTGIVKAVVFSPSNKIIASGGWDQPPFQGKIRLWSIDGTLLNTIDNNGIGIDSVDFSSDNSSVVTVSGDSHIKLWKIAEIQSFNTDTGYLRSIDFSKDEKAIVCSGDTGKVQILRITDGEKLTDIKAHEDWAMGASISPNGEIVASISTDKTVKLWSCDGRLLKILHGHNDSVYGLAFSPDGSKLATTSADKTIRLWSVEGPFFKSLDGKQGSAHFAISCSPDGKMMASASWDTTIGSWTVKLWNIAGELQKKLTGYGDIIRTVTFSHDSNLVASASWDGTVKVWTINGELVTNFTQHGKPVPGMNSEADYRPSVNGVSFHPSGEFLISGGYDRHIRMWDLGGNQLKVIPNAHSEQIYRICFSTDGKTLATASWDRTIKIWTIDGKLLHTLSGHSNWLYGLSFSPDSKIIASTSLDRAVKLWNAEDGKLLHNLVGHTDGIFDVSFSTNGKMIASASLDKTVKLWSTDGNLLKTISGHDNAVYGVSFSNDRIVVSASWDGSIKLWSTEILNFDDLLKRGCNHIQNYVTHNPNVSNEDRRLILEDQL